MINNNIVLILIVILLYCNNVIPFIVSSSSNNTSQYNNYDPNTIRTVLWSMVDQGKYIDLIKVLDDVEARFGSLDLDGTEPSLYLFKGVALVSSTLRNPQESVKVMYEGVKKFPKETRMWINIGEIETQLFHFSKSVKAYEKAVEIGDVFALSRLLKSKGWGASWKNLEHIASQAYKFSEACFQGVNLCYIDTASGLEYAHVPGLYQKHFHTISPNAKSSNYKIPTSDIANLWNLKAFVLNKHRRLKIGLLSSDFGNHPVATLLRGIVQEVDKKRIELFLFAVHDEFSWWSANVSVIAEHYIELYNLNTFDAAQVIASKGIEILIDLNGHTVNTGLPIMAHKPGLIQITYLGLPTTSGAEFIDYIVGDTVVAPPEMRNQFTENLALLNLCYIANDYANLRGSAVKLVGKDRYPRPSNLRKGTFIFATLSNYQKIDPSIYHVWMNIMRYYSDSNMLMLDYSGSDEPLKNLQSYTRFFGVSSRRMVTWHQQPWVEHIQAKSIVDLLLDTPIKTGHTTGLDGVWAGVPTITTAGSENMMARAGESIARTLESEFCINFSLKEYEDLVYRLLPSPKFLKEFEDYLDEEDLIELMNRGEFLRLAILKKHVQNQRIASALFDVPFFTKSFVGSMEAIWEASHYTPTKHKRFHIFATSRPKRNHDVKIYDHYQFDLNYAYKHDFTYTNDTSNNITLPDPPKKLNPFAEKFEKILQQNTKQTMPESKLVHNVKSQDSVKKVDSNNAVNYKNVNFYSSNPNEVKYENIPLPAKLFETANIFLNIGANCYDSNGWFYVIPQRVNHCIKPEQEILRLAHDLEGFPDNSVSLIYSSHMLEHTSYGDDFNLQTLREWRRVTRPGGMLFIAVPDLDVLCRMYLDPKMTTEQRLFIARMIYGGQTDRYDFHLYGYNEESLTLFLKEAGYCKMQRVGNFNLFGDTSALVKYGYNISLNMVASVCRQAGENDDGFYIEHSADKYVKPKFIKV